MKLVERLRAFMRARNQIDEVAPTKEQESAVSTHGSALRVAVHESGHTLVARVLTNTSSGLTVSMSRERGYSYEGFARANFPSTTDALGLASVHLAGLTAELMIFGVSSAKASQDDLLQARSLAQSLVQLPARSEEWAAESGIDFRARFKSPMRDQTNFIMRAAHGRAKSIIREHRRSLLALSSALLRKELLAASEIEKAYSDPESELKFWGN